MIRVFWMLLLLEPRDCARVFAPFRSEMVYLYVSRRWHWGPENRTPIKLGSKEGKWKQRRKEDYFCFRSQRKGKRRLINLHTWTWQDCVSWRKRPESHRSAPMQLARNPRHSYYPSPACKLLHWSVCLIFFWRCILIMGLEPGLYLFLFLFSSCPDTNISVTTCAMSPYSLQSWSA